MNLHASIVRTLKKVSRPIEMAATVVPHLEVKGYYIYQLEYFIGCLIPLLCDTVILMGPHHRQVAPRQALQIQVMHLDKVVNPTVQVYQTR